MTKLLVAARAGIILRAHVRDEIDGRVRVRLPPHRGTARDEPKAVRRAAPGRARKYLRAGIDVLLVAVVEIAVHGEADAELTVDDGNIDHRIGLERVEGAVIE